MKPLTCFRAWGIVMAKKCLICQKPVDQAYRPFCSKRCADIDLGRWLNGSYVIPGEELVSAERHDVQVGEEDNE